MMLYRVDGKRPSFYALQADALRAGRAADAVVEKIEIGEKGREELAAFLNALVAEAMAIAPEPVALPPEPERTILDHPIGKVWESALDRLKAVAPHYRPILVEHLRDELEAAIAKSYHET